MRKSLLALAAVLVLAAPTAVAHAAAPPRDFETRILHDHNDDSAVVLAGRHGFDAIALDARDARLPDGRPALVLRLLLNGGCNPDAPGDCPELSHVVTFTAGGEARSVAFRTEDGGETWTGDAAHYAGPEGINDGTRFAVEGWVPLAQLGVAPGDALTDWFVTGHAGSDAADNMPEGIVAGVPDPLGGAFDAGEYVPGGPDFYLALEQDGDAVRVTNLLAVEQTVTLRVAGGNFEDGNTTDLALAANFTKEIAFSVPAGAPAAVVATTPLGGFAVLPLTTPPDAAAAPTEAGSPDPRGNETAHQGTGHDSHHDGDHDHGPDVAGDASKDAPGLPVALAGLALVGLAAARRRR